jgi:amidase
MSDQSLISKSATQLHQALARDELTPIDLLDALEERIALVDGDLNAITTACFDRARTAADALARKPMSERGLLLGLPVAIKDLQPVAGVRSTWGSPIYSDFIPDGSDCMVEQVENNDGIIYAKTNTPEFGAGANTFNEVFGATLNPWDMRKSCAGSSGGSAVALASGTAWLASGSDLGGSLRNPASFCSIVGFRPSPGRVAHGPARAGAFPASLGGMPNDPFSISGPMARNVPDLALLMDAMVGHHRADPLSMPREAQSYRAAVAARKMPARVAFSPDFGVTPVDPEVAAVCATAARKFEQMGCIVEEAHPDFHDVQDLFQTYRAISFYVGKKGLLDSHRDALKPEVIWNIERAGAITMDDIARVELARARYIARATEFFDTYDLLLSPATIVPPYPIEDRYVASCGDVEFDNYIQWCTIAYAITLTGFPALSVPAGFTASGLPVGLQMVTGPRAEADLLAAAAVYEEHAGLAGLVPIEPRKLAQAVTG